ncbi:unnamed protein product [Brassica napus]|uniref:(rape) hypothetical protein n=1 Tax=Brassica napus TaxID=3708 RepID=A0A816R0P1_BRANA|nr:unnamed protein product [Brassica napus]
MAFKNLLTKVGTAALKAAAKEANIKKNGSSSEMLMAEDRKGKGIMMGGEGVTGLVRGENVIGGEDVHGSVRTLARG